MPDTPLSTRGGLTSIRTTRHILRGSIYTASLLAVLLFTYDIVARSVWLDDKLWVIFAALAYLLVGDWLLRKGKQKIVNWMIVWFYIILAFCTQLTWGLNAPVGILTMSFAVILPSTLMGARSIPPVVFIIIASLFAVQLLTHYGLIKPDTQPLSLPSTIWDVLSYATILGVFGLVAWLASSQREKNLQRALQAELALTRQKDILRQDLEKESATLRLTQLKQIRELHSFALLGQSTAATLHELSNHLSILNLDIDDLEQQHSQSKAIANAKTSLAAINQMIRKTRQQLNSYNQVEQFNAIFVINQSVKDMHEKFDQHRIKVTRQSMKKPRSFIVKGSPFALMQIVTILIKNAIDACRDSPYPEVIIRISSDTHYLSLAITDNGPGIDPAMHPQLFKPTASTKTTGMGVGLYIARSLAKSQFNGELKLNPTDTGAEFILRIPRDGAK